MDDLNQTKKTARVAGLLYLIVVISGIFNLAYVPSQLFESGDTSATIKNIISNEYLFRSGIAGGFICYIAFLVLPFVLYRFLSKVDKTSAILMVTFAVISVPISLVNLLHLLDVLSLVSEPYYANVLTDQQLQTEVSLHFDTYYNGLHIAKIFWGLWLMPFGYLVFKSKYLPKILGILLMMGCVGYQVDVFGQTLFKNYMNTILADYATLPASVGEIGTCLWLLIIGVRKPK